MSAIPAPEDDASVPRYLLAASLSLLVVVGVETLVRVGGYVMVRETTLPASEEYLVGVATSLPFLLGVAYGARVLLRDDSPREHHLRVLRWVLAGTLVSLLINVPLMTVTPALHPWHAVAWFRWAAALGGGVGMLVGMIELRGITNALEAERARLRTEHIEEQRDTLDYLNSLLRHEVLNGINVVEGHSMLLAERIDDPETEAAHIDPIVRRSRDIGTVVSDVRTLMQVIDGDRELRAVDLRPVLKREVRKLEDTHPEAEVSVDLPDDLYALADDMVNRIFGNVLANAVEHNDSEPPRVSVEGRTYGDEVEVRISDNGSGIDEGTRQALFERPRSGPADHGFGLYVVSRLCTHYDGAIELVETGAAGTTFGITLQAGSPRFDAASEGPATTESEA